MLSLTRFQHNFTVNLRLAVLMVFICCIFVRLGFWQLSRAEEKKQMLSSQHRLEAETPIDWSPTKANPIQYQLTHVRGRFLNATLLLDNQHYHHEFGYDVLSPLVLGDGQVVLIDRGWILGDVNREILPSVSIPTGVVDIVGSAYYPDERHWFFGGVVDRTYPHLVVIEFIDAHIISQFLHKSVYPFIIRMRPEASDGFVRDWPVVAFSPDRHFAYAVQWFAMALLVAILFIISTVKKKNEN